MFFFLSKANNVISCLTSTYALLLSCIPASRENAGKNFEGRKMAKFDLLKLIWFLKPNVDILSCGDDVINRDKLFLNRSVHSVGKGSNFVIICTVHAGQVGARTLTLTRVYLPS